MMYCGKLDYCIQTSNISNKRKLPTKTIRSIPQVFAALNAIEPMLFVVVTSAERARSSIRALSRSFLLYIFPKL